MGEIEEISFAKPTIKKLIENGTQRVRRAIKSGYVFTHIALPLEGHPLPEHHEAALSRDLKTLYIRKESVQCLLDTGSVTCRMGEKKSIKFLVN